MKAIPVRQERAPMTKTVGPTAALAGIPAGIQAIGAWQGRRQLFVRFAAEAETATMYTGDALGGELKRLAARSSYHSVSIAGRDPLANADFLGAMLEKHDVPLPVMLDHDGQRPEALAALLSRLSLVQVVMDGSEPAVTVERAAESLRLAAGRKVAHALVLCPGEQATDSQLLRLVEQAHVASAETQVVVHPPVGVPLDRDRRWITLIERAVATHADVRLALRIPGPTGMR
jgi:hypothetical protein